MEVSRFREFWKTYALTSSQVFYAVDGFDVRDWRSRVLGILVFSSDMFEMKRREAFLVLDATDPHSDVRLAVTVNELPSKLEELESYMEENGVEILRKLSGIVLFDPTIEYKDPVIREIEKDTRVEVKFMHGGHFQKVLNKYGALYDKFGSGIADQLEAERDRSAELKRQLTRTEDNLRALKDEFNRFASRDFRQKQIQAWRDHYSMDAVHQVGNEITQLSLPLRKAVDLVEKGEDASVELKKVSAARVQMERLISRLLGRGVGKEFSKSEIGLDRIIAESEVRCVDREVSFSAAEVLRGNSNLSLILDLDGFLRVISELADNSFYWIGTVQEVPNIRMRLEHTVSVDGHNEVQFIWQDNGPGVEDEDKELIFLPTQSGRMEGTGTGLVFVRRFFENHGGEVVECGDHGYGFRVLGRIPLKGIEV